MNINELPQTELIKYIRSLDSDSIISLFNQNVNNNILNMLFLNADELTKKRIINDDYTYNKLVNILKINRRKIVSYISDDILVLLLTKVDNNLQKEILLSLKDDKFLVITQKLNEINVNMEYIENGIISRDEFEKLYNKYYIYKIKNKLECDILNKYHIYFSAEVDDNNLIINSNYYLPYDIFLKINDKRINTLLEKAIESNPHIDKGLIFVTVIKMYAIFGYDNSYKILENKFTYRTDSSVYRAGEAWFIDERRQFRLENQELFYSYDLITKIINALENNNLSFFSQYCRDKDDERLLNNFIHNLQFAFKEYSHGNQQLLRRNLISDIVKKEIIAREELLKQKSIKDFKKNYLALKKRSPLSIVEMYNILDEFTIDNIKLDDKGRIIINNKLNKFLLGNTKSDNDALLRLVLNKDAFGINDTLGTIINDFKKIDRIIAKSHNLSLNSILDVIDVCKASSYNLQPNEEDMTLQTVATLLQSTKFCTEPKDVIFARACKLHVEKRKKVCSSIPIVSGVSKNGIKYEVARFDDPNILVSGINSGDCLKIGGYGEDFLHYLLKSPHGVIVYLTDQNNNKYICPFIRNGNGIFGNGIDPEPESEYIANFLLEALQECTQDMMLASDSHEEIEFATVTDLHQKRFFSEQDLPIIKIDQYLPIDGVFYSDYHKDELTTYIINSLISNPQYNPYVPNIMFYEKRLPGFVMDINTEDKERIEIVINSINYSFIDYMNLTDEEKNSARRRYKRLKVEDYDYIIGNKDWFIAINELEIISRVLPFDARAREEYLIGLEGIRKKYSGGIKK